MSRVARLAGLAYLLASLPSVFAQDDHCGYGDFLTLNLSWDAVNCTRASDLVSAFTDPVGECCLGLDIVTCTADESCAFWELFDTCGICVSVTYLNDILSTRGDTCEETKSDFEENAGLQKALMEIHCEEPTGGENPDCCYDGNWNMSLASADPCIDLTADECVAAGEDSECSIMYYEDLDCFRCTYAYGILCSEVVALNTDNLTRIICDSNLISADSCNDVVILPNVTSTDEPVETDTTEEPEETGTLEPLETGTTEEPDDDDCVEQFCQSQWDQCEADEECNLILEAIDDDTTAYLDIVNQMQNLCGLNDSNFTCGVLSDAVIACITFQCFDCPETECTAELSECYDDESCNALMLEMTTAIDYSMSREFAESFCEQVEFADMCNDAFWNAVDCIDSQCMNDTLLTTEEPISSTDIDTSGIESTFEVTAFETTSTIETTSPETTSPVESCDFDTYCACIGGTFTIKTEDDMCKAYDDFVEACKDVFASADAVLAFDPATCLDSTATSMDVTVSWSFESAETYETYNKELKQQLDEDYLFNKIKQYEESSGATVDFLYEDNGFSYYSDDENKCDWSDNYVDLDEYFDAESVASKTNVVIALMVSLAAFVVAF